MERLPCSDSAVYEPTEAAIHVSRYAGAIALCPGKRVLDVACGEGYGAFLMAQAGAAEVIGVDNSAEAVATATGHFPHPRLRFLTGDACNLDAILGDTGFDLIVSLETMEHLLDPVGFLKAIQQRRAEDGTIILSCPNDHWYYAPDNRNPYHTRKYTFDEFRSLTEGFLGVADAWLLGTAALGYATVPAERPLVGRTGADYARVHPLGAAFLCLPDAKDPISPNRSSYFLGIWGPGTQMVQGAALLPLSMDRYARLSQADRLASALAHESAGRQSLAQALQAAEAALQQQQQDAEERAAEAHQNAMALLERTRMELEQAREALGQTEQQSSDYRRRAEQEQRLGRVQLHALRKENTILMDSVARLQAELSKACSEHVQREHLAAEQARQQAIATSKAHYEQLAADYARLVEERQFLLTERQRIFARMRPIWRIAQLIPWPIRRALRWAGRPLLRRLAPQA